MTATIVCLAERRAATAAGAEAAPVITPLGPSVREAASVFARLIDFGEANARALAGLAAEAADARLASCLQRLVGALERGAAELRDLSKDYRLPEPGAGDGAA